MVWLIWVGAALVLGIVELLTVDLFFLTLALASLSGGIAALAGGSIWVQIAVFVATSTLALAFVRPWAKDLLHRSTPDVATNAQGLVGKPAIVTEPLVGSAGRVRLEGGIWSARGVDQTRYPVGSAVTVVAIEGATAVVGPPGEVIPTPANQQPPGY